MTTTHWTIASATSEIDVMRWDHGGKTYALHDSPDGEFFCNQGICTHGDVHRAGGLVMDDGTGRPKHDGQFEYRTGQAMRAPVCVNLKPYPAPRERSRPHRPHPTPFAPVLKALP